MLWRLGKVTVIKRAPEGQVIVIKSKVGADFLVDEAGVEVVGKLSCPEGRRKAAAAAWRVLAPVSAQKFSTTLRIVEGPG